MADSLRWRGCVMPSIYMGVRMNSRLPEMARARYAQQIGGCEDGWRPAYDGAGALCPAMM